MGKSDKITNYFAIGDNVHTVGVQPGNTKSVEISPNAADMGLFGKHGIADIIDSFID